MVRWTHFVGLGLAVLLSVLLVWRSGFGASSDPLGFYAPDDFVNRADSMIARGLLAADCRGPQPRLVPNLESASAADRSWYRESYLQSDVERFNSDPNGFGWAFAIDSDCRLRGVNPAVHAIELPFRRRLRWLGSILYRGQGADASLQSSQRTITLRKIEKPVPASASATTRVGSQESVFDEGSVLLHFPGGEGLPAARMFHIGDSVVVQNRVRGGSGQEARLMGHRLPVGRWARLETGDWLSFESTQRYSRADETFVFLGGETRELASVVRRQNDSYDRRTDDAGLGAVADPVRDSSYPYLELVAKSIDRVLPLFPEAEGEELANGFDVQLTLERQTQTSLNETFREHCLAVQKDFEARLPFAAGLTVMDGLNGDVLAAATYPSPEDLEGFSELGRSRRRLLQNQNFVLHPIGSAGKPFLFAAAAEAVPQLLDLEIAGHEAERYHPEIFQCQIPLGYQLLEGHVSERIDFAQALEMSCNKYTIELVTLALAAGEPGRAAPQGGGLEALLGRDEGVEWPKIGRRSGVWVGQRELSFPPRLGGYFLRGADIDDEESGARYRCLTMDRLDLSSIRRPLQQLTGAATYSGEIPAGLPTDSTRSQLEQGYLSSRYDFGPWRPLIDHLSAYTDDESTQLRLRAAMQQISPERVNLAFNQITRVRGDYISLLLGGGSSIWTNLQLAEATSRLVTGRDVRARMVAGVLARDAEEPLELPKIEPPELEMNAQVRAQVLAGMSQVVSGVNATAKPLRDELRKVREAFPNDTIALYSKTGSPIIERSVPAVAGTALERLVVRGRLSLKGGKLTVQPGERQIAWARRGNRGRSAAVEALNQALAEVGFRRSQWIRGVVTRILDRYQQETLKGRDGDGPLTAENGDLRVDRSSPLFDRQMIRGMAGVYTFALVRLPGQAELPPRAAALESPDARVLTVALHLEADEGSELAVAAAEKILPQLIPLLR